MALVGVVSDAAASTPPTEPPSTEPLSSEVLSSEAAAPLFDTAAPFDPSERVVAVADDGSVVVIAVSEDGAPDEPFAVFDAGDGYVDGVALDADRSTVFIGVCCAPGTIHVATADDGETDSFDGSAPVTSPDRASLAHVLDTSISVVDIASGETTAIDTAGTDSFTPFDVMWLDDDHVVTFGATDTQSFEFRSFDAASGSLTSSAPAGEGGQPNYQFIGVDAAGEVVVVDLPLEPTMDAQLLRLDPETLVPLDAAPDTTTLPVGTQSASLNAAATHLVTVDADGVLSIDGEPLAGTYRWAAWA